MHSTTARYGRRGHYTSSMQRSNATTDDTQAAELPLALRQSAAAKNDFPHNVSAVHALQRVKQANQPTTKKNVGHPVVLVNETQPET